MLTRSVAAHKISSTPQDQQLYIADERFFPFGLINMWQIILGLVIGYLLGALNPAYLLGKMKGIDIREVGMKNAGTRNIRLVLGTKYAIPTAIYDTCKGIVAVWIGGGIGNPLGTSIFCGFAALLGHKYPFYMGFKGGQGSATFVGLMLYSTIQYLREDPRIVLILFIVVPLAALFFYISHVDTMIGLVMVPLLAFSFFVYYPGFPLNLPLAIMMGFMVWIYLVDIYTRKKLVITNENYVQHKWRVLSRPFACLFLVFYLFMTKIALLVLIGVVANWQTMRPELPHD